MTTDPQALARRAAIDRFMEAVYPGMRGNWCMAESDETFGCACEGCVDQVFRAHEIMTKAEHAEWLERHSRPEEVRWSLAPDPPRGPGMYKRRVAHQVAYAHSLFHWRSDV